MPGDDPGGIIVTILLGIAGGVVGGWLGSLIGLGGSGFIGSLILAVVGAVILLALYRYFLASKAK
ncbi:MAG: GlsB/YeaQ/YmgE family stress response membrane protein [Anaerolineae bacterium]